MNYMNRKKPTSANISLFHKGTKPDQLVQQLNSAQGKFAEIINRWAGSMSFVYFHILWFGFWISANHGFLKPFIPTFDPFPYGLLTMIVSLEAIFLSTFILIAQNRQALVDTYRELEDEQEQKIEDKEQEELEQDVEEISQDVDEIGRDVDKIQAGLNDLITAVTQMQQRIMTAEKNRQANNGDQK
ncbi:MAG: DUF1003 domain-containing protein [Candidatus Levybacteria bacterium]|nr:DUF1003 domain-containing protein [Candidatus Levybacteria bacterium]